MHLGYVNKVKEKLVPSNFHGIRKKYTDPGDIDRIKQKMGILSGISGVLWLIAA